MSLTIPLFFPPCLFTKKKKYFVPHISFYYKIHHGCKSSSCPADPRRWETPTGPQKVKLIYKYSADPLQLYGTNPKEQTTWKELCFFKYKNMYTHTHTVGWILETSQVKLPAIYMTCWIYNGLRGTRVLCICFSHNHRTQINSYMYAVIWNVGKDLTRKFCVFCYTCKHHSKTSKPPNQIDCRFSPSTGKIRKRHQKEKYGNPIIFKTVVTRIMSLTFWRGGGGE